MSQAKIDPLLGATRILLVFILALLGIVAMAITIAIIGLIAGPDQIVESVTAGGGTLSRGVVLIGCLALALFVGVIALGFRFFLLLRRIVDSVGEGDPFIAANAKRLLEMGWISLGAQLIMLPIGALAASVDEALSKIPNVDVDFDVGLSIEPTDLLITLILFILARVFRKGAEMYADLEGTV